MNTGSGFCDEQGKIEAKIRLPGFSFKINAITNTNRQVDIDKKISLKTVRTFNMFNHTCDKDTYVVGRRFSDRLVLERLQVDDNFAEISSVFSGVFFIVHHIFDIFVTRSQTV